MLLVQQKAMEVGEHDLGLAQLVAQIGGHQVVGAIVIACVIGQQHAQPVADRDAGCDDEKGVGEARVLRVGQLVERLPGDQHGHHEGLARAGCHLEGDTVQEWVGVLVGCSQAVFDPGVAVLAGDLGQVDGGLQRLDLAEEEPAARDPPPASTPAAGP